MPFYALKSILNIILISSKTSIKVRSKIVYKFLLKKMERTSLSFMIGLKTKGGYTINNPLDYSESGLNQIFSDIDIFFKNNAAEVISEYVLRGLKKLLLEGAIKIEVLRYVKAQRYPQSAGRVVNCNGCRDACLRKAKLIYLASKSKVTQ